MPVKSATLIDTGPIVASLNARDPYHERCLEAFKQLGPFVYTCWPVLTEAFYLLGDCTPATSKLFTSLRTRTYRILSLGPDDLDGIEEVLAKYADQGFQLADATLMYLAEREGIRQVLTLDEKDFSLFRTNSGESLSLLPGRDE